MRSTGWFLYALRCSDETLYTGVTTDLARRVSEHNSGQGARYTAGRRPVMLIGAWRFTNRSAAQRAEARFRRLPRREKLQRIARQLPFAGSSFCSDETVVALLSPICFCHRCGSLLRTIKRRRNDRPRQVCSVCGRVHYRSAKPCERQGS
jgi:putative endonuclease